MANLEVPTHQKTLEEEFPLAIQDFNRMCQNKWNQVLEKLENFEQVLETRTALVLSKMSEEQKNMTQREKRRRELEAKAKKESEEQENRAPDVFEDSIFSKFESQKGAASAVVGGGNKSRGGRSTVKKSARKVAVAPSTVVRQSSRKRVFNDSSNIVPSTPLNTGTGYMGGMASMTPMITPKFNISTPLALTARRLPRENEILSSLNGSPVAAEKAGRGRKKDQADALVNLVQVKSSKATVMLPLADDIDMTATGLTLDDEHYRKLEAMERNIKNLLKMRNASSESD
eukprot:TRINITY_DN229_c0_g1_i1.p1 TRINITY_DN229_c0_g1~~TRINITY_DN229_c0_g1_i1.p1  ORF type:complete len:287 (+),score=91.96 TRINITY_DN229_c0_g1_i1:98-958(+)